MQFKSPALFSYLVGGEVDERLLDWLVLQVDGGRSRNGVDLVDLRIVGLLWLSEQNVDKGSLS